MAKSQFDFGGFSLQTLFQGVELPLRVYPGGLSVSRSFGDIQAKLPSYGGKPSVLIASPEIRIRMIEPNVDFIFMGCDGIFDVFSTESLNSFLWQIIEKSQSKGP